MDYKKTRRALAFVLSASVLFIASVPSIEARIFFALILAIGIFWGIWE